MNQEDLNKLATWKLLQARTTDADEEVKRRWSSFDTLKFRNTDVANEYFKKIDMAELLQIEKPKKFTDLFNNGKTASIWEYYGVYLYKTNGNKASLDLLAVVQELRGLESLGNAMSYLSEMFGVEYGEDSPKIKAINRSIERFRSHALAVDLEKVYPNAHKLLKNRVSQYGNIISQILTVFQNYIIEVNGEPRMLSSLGTRELSRRIFGNESGYGRISKALNIMVFLGFIDKLDNDEIPADLLEQLLNFQNKNGHGKRADVFETKQMEFDFLKSVDRKAGDWFERGGTASAMSRDGMIHSYDKDLADKMFVQDKNNPYKHGVTDRVLAEVLQFIYDCIAKNGYAEEKEVVAYIRLHYKYGEKKAREKLKQIRKPITIDYGLNRCRLNTALKKSFNVTANYRETQAPFIYTTA